MSAQLTYEPVTTERGACYVSDTGYAICAACYHSAPNDTYTRSRDLSGTCDRCGALLLYSVEIVKGMAWIEHPPCKIF